MDEAHPMAAPMIGKSKTNDDPYQPREEEEEVIDKDRYLTTVGSFTYLTNHTRPDIAFATSILARHSQSPTMRHWNGVKHLLRYLKGTSNLGLYYQKSNSPKLQGFADSGFRKYPNAGKSQTGYIFLSAGHPSPGNPQSKPWPQPRPTTRSCWHFMRHHENACGWERWSGLSTSNATSRRMRLSLRWFSKTTQLV